MLALLSAQAALLPAQFRADREPVCGTRAFQNQAEQKMPRGTQRQSEPSHARHRTIASVAPVRTDPDTALRFQLPPPAFLLAS